MTTLKKSLAFVLVLVLCAACMLIDGLVHLLRWRPHKVWASFFRRIGGKEEQEEHKPDTGRVRRQWVYADGTTTFDEVAVEEPAPQPPERIYAPLMIAQEDAFSGRHSPYERPVERTEQPVAVETAAEEMPARRTQRRRRYTPEATEDMPLRYAPPPRAEDAPAYNAPYIPPQWKKPSNAGTTTFHGGSSL